MLVIIIALRKEGDMRWRFTAIIILFGFIMSFPGCTNRKEKEFVSTGEKVLTIARGMVGRPYQYQGETPSGFDCSGLVRYSYLAIGRDVPHATSELKEAGRRVEEGDLRKGDLVFFERKGKEFGHVGLYAGDGRFIHAPSPGKYVRIDSLLDPYWKQRFSGARRF